jgi:beta-N-acetylhexosaminidase
MRSALITGLSGLTLTSAEYAFLKSTRPAGIILFARNCASPEQISRLVAEGFEAIGTDKLMVLIDQEGGRVRRLRPPLWRDLPAARAYADLYARDPEAACTAAHLVARLTASDLRAIGVNTNCAPVLDVEIMGAHDIIGDRAYGRAPAQIAALGRAVAEGYLSGGVIPVIKHIPGHGRALADSHFELPIVTTHRADLETLDFAPFQALADMPAAMTAHVVYTALDAGAPASTSAVVTREIIRGVCRFGGLLMSDDLSMKALTGPMRERAGAVIAAGSDVALHCNGDLVEMELAASGVPSLSGVANARFEHCINLLKRADAFDVAEAETTVTRLVAQASDG